MHPGAEAGALRFRPWRSPPTVAEASTVRLLAAVRFALEAIEIVVVAVSVAVASACPIVTRPPPPFDEIAETLPRLSVWITMFNAVSWALPPIVFDSFGVTVAVDVAVLTSTTPPPEPEPDAVAMPSPDGAPASVPPPPTPSSRCLPAPCDVRSSTRFWSPAPTEVRSTPSIAKHVQARRRGCCRR